MGRDPGERARRPATTRLPAPVGLACGLELGGPRFTCAWDRPRSRRLGPGQPGPPGRKARRREEGSPEATSQLSPPSLSQASFLRSLPMAAKQLSHGTTGRLWGMPAGHPPLGRHAGRGARQRSLRPRGCSCVSRAPPGAGAGLGILLLTWEQPVCSRPASPPGGPQFSC